MNITAELVSYLSNKWSPVLSNPTGIIFNIFTIFPPFTTHPGLLRAKDRLQMSQEKKSRSGYTVSEKLISSEAYLNVLISALM